MYTVHGHYNMLKLSFHRQQHQLYTYSNTMYIRHKTPSQSILNPLFVARQTILQGLINFNNTNFGDYTIIILYET